MTTSEHVMPSYLLRLFQRPPAPAPARLVNEVEFGAPEEQAAIQEARNLFTSAAPPADFARLFAPDRTVVWCADLPAG